MSPRIYGHDRTIHRTTQLDVETKDGKVVAVWYRCQLLPFQQVEVDEQRANEMLNELNQEDLPGLLAVELDEE